MDYSQLFRPEKPGLHIIEMERSKFDDLVLQLAYFNKDAVVKRIRGGKCKTVDALFDEVAAALQFPIYFGQNWPAFDECINDLEWIEGTAYVLLIIDAPLLLSEDSDADFKVLIKVLSNANTEWLEPNKYYPRNRPPTSFQVVFQCTSSEILPFTERLKRATEMFDVW
jgi:hypothetical protein